MKVAFYQNKEEILLFSGTGTVPLTLLAIIVSRSLLLFEYCPVGAAARKSPLPLQPQTTLQLPHCIFYECLASSGASFENSKLSDVTEPDAALSARWRCINPRTYFTVEAEPSVWRRCL